MNHNFVRWMLALLFSFALVATPVVAIGISPGKTLLEFSPSLQDSITVTVVNTEQKDMDVVLYTEGELAPYVSISPDRLSFTKDEYEKQATYEIKLPRKLEEPGTHGAQIIAREVAKQTEGELVVQALLAVASGVEVRVPYPGKYITSHFYVAPEEGKPVPFLLQVHNLGDEAIKGVQATITILDQREQVVGSVLTERVGLAASKRVDLTSQWDSPVAFGRYTAEAVIRYDGLTKTVRQEFQTGSFTLEALDISVKDFTLGEVAKFNVLVKNTGEQDVEKAVAQIVLHTQEEVTIANFKSVDTLVRGDAVKALLAYWDTEGVKQGTYEGVLTLLADEVRSDHRIRTTVTETEIKTEFIGLTGMAISPGSSSISGLTALSKESSIALLTVVVILINTVGWYVYFKRRDKGKLMDDF